MAELTAYAFGGRVLDLRLHVLDRQVLDSADVPIGHIDDLEIEDVPPGRALDPAAPPIVLNLVLNSGMWQRMFGGRPPSTRLHRIPWSAVSDVGTAIALGESGDQYDVTWAERWVRDHVIARIPGGRHAPE